MIKCGKAACACAEDPNARHGPYQCLTQAVAGKTRSRFLTAQQTALALEVMPEGGQVRISASFHEGWVLILVEDTLPHPLPRQCQTQAQARLWGVNRESSQTELLGN